MTFRSILRFDAAEESSPLSIPTAIAGSEHELVACDAGQLWMPAADGVMRPFIASQGMWSPDENWFFKQIAQPGLRFLDVGANVGYFSLLIASLSPGSKIFSVEPHPQLVQLLRLNLWHNRVAATVLPVALTAGERSVTLSSAVNNPGDTRTESASAGRRATTVVPGIAFDDLLPDATFDVIKIDVQGFESEVLTGMASTLRRNPQVTIVAEFWPGGIRERGANPRSTLDIYSALGLEFSLLTKGKILPATASEVMRFAESGGGDGQANLVMHPKVRGVKKSGAKAPA